MTSGPGFGLQIHSGLGDRVRQALTAERAADGEGAEAAEEASDVAAVLPGAPELADAVDAEEEDVDFDVAELEGFGRMNVYRGPDDGAGAPLDGQQSVAPADEGLLTAGEASDAEPALAITTEEPVQQEQNDSNQ